MAAEANVPFIGAIPIDSAVREGGDQGIPVVISAPDSPVSKALIAMARDVAAKISIAAVN
jgi:ATP-binding protein involved in chromosome partitioning